MNQIPIPNRSHLNPYHSFLACPKCFKYTLKVFTIHMKRGKNKKGMKCTNCKHDLTDYSQTENIK